MKTLIYAIRFLTRSKSYTIINLLGLAFSLACCIILIRYIHRELTVDTHCVDREQVYAIQKTIEGNHYLGDIGNQGQDSICIPESAIDMLTSIRILENDHHPIKRSSQQHSFWKPFRKLTPFGNKYISTEKPFTPWVLDIHNRVSVAIINREKCRMLHRQWFSFYFLFSSSVTCKRKK